MVNTAIIDSFISICFKGVTSIKKTTEFVIFGICENVDNNLKELSLTNNIDICVDILNEQENIINEFKSLQKIRSNINSNIFDIHISMEKIELKLNLWKNSYFKYWVG